MSTLQLLQLLIVQKFISIFKIDYSMIAMLFFNAGDGTQLSFVDVIWVVNVAFLEAFPQPNSISLILYHSPIEECPTSRNKMLLQSFN
jgi:hypothetical protein